MRQVYFLILILFLTACTPTTPNTDKLADSTHKISDTMGCQPGEIKKDGTCVPKTEENNAEIFGKLDATTITTEAVPEVPGFLARPAKPGEYPGVVMIHEWWGLNDNIKTMAKHLAKEGYIVLAVDLYDGEVAETSGDARKLVTEVRENQEQATKALKKAVAYLREKDEVKTIGSLGWCFGGGQSLQLAISGEKMDATVIYYGQLTDDIEELAQIEWPVLGIFGEKDSSIPVTAVNKFEKTLDELNIVNEINIYPGVDHAFANPSGERFAPKETKDAWEKTIAFLNANLKED